MELNDDEIATAGSLPARVTSDFIIDDHGKATWAVGKIAANKRAQEDLKAQFGLLMRELQNEEESLLLRFGSQLQAWAEKELTGKRQRSMKLLTGAVGFRLVPGRMSVTDKAEAEAYAKENVPGAFRTEVKFMAGEYLVLAGLQLRGTGEMWPGIEQVEARDSFYIKPVDAGLHARVTEEGGDASDSQG